MWDKTGHIEIGNNNNKVSKLVKDANGCKFYDLFNIYWKSKEAKCLKK
jgi:hypothetical protein